MGDDYGIYKDVTVSPFLIFFFEDIISGNDCNEPSGLKVIAVKLPVVAGVTDSI